MDPHLGAHGRFYWISLNKLAEVQEAAASFLDEDEVVDLLINTNWKDAFFQEWLKAASTEDIVNFLYTVYRR